MQKQFVFFGAALVAILSLDCAAGGGSQDNQSSLEAQGRAAGVTGGTSSSGGGAGSVTLTGSSGGAGDDGSTSAGGDDGPFLVTGDDASVDAPGDDGSVPSGSIAASSASARKRRDAGVTSSSSGSTSSSGSSSGTASSSGGGNSSGDAGSHVPNPAAAALAAALGFPTTSGKQTFAFGYGEGSTGLDPFNGSTALGSPLQILENYLYGLDGYPGSWTAWNTDAAGSGAFVNVFFDQAKAGGAVPMFTLYQMIGFGGNNGGIGCFNDSACAASYWKDYKIILTRVAKYNLPAMLNVEPDMVGYAQSVANAAGNVADPTKVPVNLSSVSECSGMPANLIGYASCVLHLRDAYAPKLYVGFNQSDWFGVSNSITFMQAMGAGKGDFLVMETLDRDVGCFETNNPNCQRSPSPTYWGDADFKAHVAEVAQYHAMLNLPIVWWQTPLGVPSSTPGANPNAMYGYRDNKMQYFFSNLQMLANAGGMGVVFGQGEGAQADLATDILPDKTTHQFKSLLSAYHASPLPLQ